MNPLVSVVIPVYNIGALVKETIDSVLSQTYDDFEIVVVDDGSTDDTAKVIKGYRDPRIKYHYQANSGLPARPRNVGVKMSRGDHIAFLDHDDLWLPQKLEKQMSRINQDGKIAMISTNAYYIYDETRTVIPMISGLSDGYFSDRSLFPVNRVIQSTVLVNKKIFDQAGGLREDPDLKAVEDYDLWLRLYAAYPCYYIDECLAYYRKRGNSTSGNNLVNVQRGLVHYQKYFLSYGYPKKLNDQRLSHIFYNMAIIQFMAKDPAWKDSLKKAFSANKDFPGLIKYVISIFPSKLIINAYEIGRRVKRGLKGMFKW